MFDFVYLRKLPVLGEYLRYRCKLTQISMNYSYPDKYGLPFLPMEYLSIIVFKILSPEQLMDCLLKVLIEQTLIFVSDNLENLTGLV